MEIIQPGQTFAEALLFSQTRLYPVSATALKDSVLVSIEGNHYRNALEDQPKVCLAILASMSVHLHLRLRDIDTLTMASASRRVINFSVPGTPPGHRFDCLAGVQTPGGVEAGDSAGNLLADFASTGGVRPDRHGASPYQHSR